MSIKLTVIAGTADRLSSLSGQLPPADSSIRVTQFVGGIRELAAEVEHNRPDLVVAEFPVLPEVDLQSLGTVLMGAPGMALVLLSPDRTPDFLIRLMRIGVREVLAIGASADEVKGAYARQIERLGVLKGPSQRGRVLAFMPAKGGSGSTFLSTNLAYALAERGKRTAIFDMNMHFGDASLFITDARPSGSLADLAREIDRLDGTFLEASMLQVAKNLWLLGAPDSPDAAIDMSAESVERIIAVARSRFDFVVLDVGRVFESVSVRALDQADDIYIVLQATLPFIHDAKRLLGMLANLGYPRDRLRLILNRHEKGGEISEEDVRKSVGLPVSLIVPNNFRAVAHSINHGIPILRYAPREPVSRALVTMAESLAPAEERRGGWLRVFTGARG